VAEPTVFIIDDDEAYRDSVKELVSSVGLATETFGSAHEYLAAFDAARPGCLVLDLRMARMSGLVLKEKLDEMGVQIPIVFISGHGDIAMAVRAIKGGAVDFVQKPYHEQQSLDAINEALARDAAQRAPGSEGGDLTARLRSLTRREHEVMELALEGLASKVIAKRLGISHRTVEEHRSRLLEKLGVSSVTELMRLTLDRRAE